jgi:hypothetical protein
MDTMRNMKKKYEKPEIMRIKLDAQTAVLSVCKAAATEGGPTSASCGPPQFQPCEDAGS